MKDTKAAVADAVHVSVDVGPCLSPSVCLSTLSVCVKASRHFTHQASSH